MKRFFYSFVTVLTVFALCVGHYRKAYAQAVTPSGAGTFNTPVLFNAGTVTAPGIAWSADADGTGTGFYRDSANSIGVTNNGVRSFRFGTSSKLYGLTDTSVFTMDNTVGIDLQYNSTAELTIANNSISLIIAAAGTPIRFNNGIRINYAGGGSKPTCDSSTRGTLWYVQSGAGVADTLEACTKSAADAYAWRAFSTAIP